MNLNSQCYDIVICHAFVALDEPLRIKRRAGAEFGRSCSDRTSLGQISCQSIQTSLHVPGDSGLGALQGIRRSREPPTSSGGQARGPATQRGYFAPFSVPRTRSTTRVCSSCPQNHSRTGNDLAKLRGSLILGRIVRAEICAWFPHFVDILAVSGGTGSIPVTSPP